MGIPIGAMNAAVFAFQGILAALYERTKSGLGQQVGVSQLAGQIAIGPHGLRARPQRAFVRGQADDALMPGQLPVAS